MCTCSCSAEQARWIVDLSLTGFDVLDNATFEVPLPSGFRFAYEGSQGIQDLSNFTYRVYTQTENAQVNNGNLEPSYLQLSADVSGPDPHITLILVIERGQAPQFDTQTVLTIEKP